MIAVTRLRVRYQETDCMKVVYYGNYLIYFEVGRVEFLRQQGQPMSELDTRIHLPVVEAVVRYVKPARLDDLLEVRCWISGRKRASFSFTYEITHADTRELITTGETRHACWDPQSRKMIPIPDWLKTVIAEDVPDGT